MNLKEVILNLDGEPWPHATGKEIEGKEGATVKEKVDLTAKIVIEESVFSSTPETDPDEVLARYEIYLKTKDTDEVKFNKEETELLKKVVVQRYPAFISGQFLKSLTK